MKPITLILLIAAAPAFAADNADQVLRAMSAKLAASKNFTFDARRHIDASLHPHEVPENARIAVSVSRPGKISARSVSSVGARRILADGRTLTVLDEKKGYYAQVPLRGTIDELVDALDAVYGFTPPLAEFTVSNPYREFRQHARTMSYAGLDKVGGFLGMGGIECHRLALKGPEANAELWVGVADQLPHKLVATFHRGGQVRIDFAAWNLAAANSADFTFTPPNGTQKIEMWSTAKMKAARKN